MSLVEQTPTQDELLSHETQNEAPAEGEWAKTAHLDADSDPLSAARKSGIRDACLLRRRNIATYSDC